MKMRVRRCRCGAYLFVRTCHTLLTLGVASTLIFKKTELSKALYAWPNDVNAIAYTVGYFGLLAVSLIMYFTACLVQPGFVPISSKRHAWDSGSEDEEETSESATMLHETEEGRVANGNASGIKLRRCGFCEIEQPLRSHHCEDCGRCIRRYDHHCPWLETCIGEKNHKFFWLFLVTTSVLVMWTICIVWRAFVTRATWMVWFRANAFFLIDCSVLFGGGLTVLGLAGFHTYLMFSNQTTWEVVSRERITYLKNLRDDLNPFHEGYCRNTYVFLCVTGARKWDLLYKKYTNYKTADT